MLHRSARRLRDGQPQWMSDAVRSANVVTLGALKVCAAVYEGGGEVVILGPADRGASRGERDIATADTGSDVPRPQWDVPEHGSLWSQPLLQSFHRYNPRRQQSPPVGVTPRVAACTLTCVPTLSSFTAWPCVHRRATRCTGASVVEFHRCTFGATRSQPTWALSTVQTSAQIEQTLTGRTCREQCTRGRQHAVARDPKEPRIPRGMAVRLAKVALARVLALTVQKKEPPDLVARAARLAGFRQTVQHRAVRESVAEGFRLPAGGTLLDHFPAE
jgi:hypothetical protein